MTEPQSSWAFVGISPEARQAAELAAEAAGMELDTWLAQLIKYKSTMELKGRAEVPLDTAIMQIAAPAGAAAAEPETTAAPTEAQPAEPETAEGEPTAVESAAAPNPATEPAMDTEATATVEAETAPPTAEEPSPDAAPRDEREADENATLLTATPPSLEAQPADTEPADADPAPVEPEDAPEPEPEPEPVIASPTAETTPEMAATREVAAEPEPTPEPVAAPPDPTPEPKPTPVRPRADNDTGPLDDTPEPEAPEEAAATVETAAEPAAADEAEPSPRKNMPTEALRPSRLSALNQASEDTIQGAFDAWRDNRTLEPLLVRPSPNERNVFEVIVGIERWHAARRAHIRELPVLVHHATDEDAIRLAMSARLKRGPLSPLTEAKIYLSLMSEASMSTEQVARMVGKPPAHVATMVRVLNLPRGVRDMLERGELTALHARALLDAPNAEALAREVIARRLDIYQTEQLVRTANQKAERAEKVDLDAVDLDLSDGEYQDVPVDAASLDGDIGFGPETRFDSETRSSPTAAQGEDDVDDAPPFDETDADLVFDDVSEEALELIDAPEIEEEVAVAFGGGAGLAAPEEPKAAEAKAADPAPADSLAKAGLTETTGGEAKDAEAKDAEEPPAKAPLPGPRKGVVTTELLEHHLSHLLGLKVSISEWHNMGVISIHYTNRDELSDVVSRLNSGSPG